MIVMRGLSGDVTYTLLYRLFVTDATERGVEMPQEDGLFLEATLFGLSCATEDMREGTKAFLEKRAANFLGK